MGFCSPMPGPETPGREGKGGLPETFDKLTYFLFSGQITLGGGECVCGEEEGKWGKGGVQGRFFSAILVPELLELNTVHARRGPS